MVKLELDLTDIDYDSLIREYLPKVQEKLQESGSPLASMLTGGMASGMLGLMPNSMKDKLAAELVNANAARLSEQMEEVARRSGIPGRVRSLKASAESGE